MPQNIKNKAFRATAWVIVGYGMANIMRLGGNLILTRLLVPEFFGIMAIANVFILGLGLFSDIGLGPVIIRSKRSDDPVFLNTAWTLQIMRGLVLWTLTIAIALPVAKLYDNPLLTWLIPALGFAVLLESVSSTSRYTLNKKIQLGKITIMQLSAQFLGLVCMLPLAYVYRNIWSLVIGIIVTSLVKVIWSHFLEKNTSNRFAFEKSALHEFISFGKWIFVSTAMMFLATQADRLLLGKLFPLALLGIYNIAVMFAELPKQILNQLSNQVLLPLITMYIDLPRHELRAKILQKRQKLLIPLALLIALFASLGDIAITHLYDDRYHQAGWMLPILALGMWPFILNASIDRCFYALGRPKVPAAGNFIKFIYMIICVPVFFKYGGVFGAVLAVAMNDIPVYFIISWGLHREKMTCLGQDVFASLCLLMFIGLIVSLRLAFGYGVPGYSLFLGG